MPPTVVHTAFEAITLIVTFGNLRYRSPLVAVTNHDARGNAKSTCDIWFAGWANVDNMSYQWQSVTREHCVL